MINEKNNEPTPDENKNVISSIMALLRESQNSNEKLGALLETSQESNKKFADVLEKQETTNRVRMLFWLLPILFIVFSFVKQHFSQANEFDDKGYVAQVVLKGEIRMESSTASANTVIPALRNAFADEKAKGVVFRISSPGGSPTQSILIHDELVKLQEEYPEKKLVVIGEEGLTSGAYWIAAAAEEIHVLPATMTGSIGVIFSTWDVSKLASKYDIKRRIITSGTNKSRIDPFIEPRDEDIEKLRSLASKLHTQFINVVKSSRKERLVGNPDDIFSGDFWLGETALELGLVDSITSTSRLLQKEFGTDAVKDYSRKPGFFESMKPGNPLASINDANSLLSLWNVMTQSDYPTIH